MIDVYIVVRQTDEEISTDFAGYGSKEECDRIAAGIPGSQVHKLDPPGEGYRQREDGCWVRDEGSNG